MRAGGACAAQQTLSPEAGSVLKHSLTLARRRGHAQVTPLHVAATLLSSKTSILKRACLKSQPHQSSHPLQCRALDLCFNVALTRLPATASPLLHAQPSLSNALVAALKRAQAHQRRGCIEQQQQQPIIAVKVELEQLILSILDDPSVSRVMREAGFSSALVKNSLEDPNPVSSVFQCYNSVGGIYSTPSSPPNDTQKEAINTGNFWHSQSQLLTDQNRFIFSTLNKSVTSPISGSYLFKEEIEVVLDVLLRKRGRKVVIVGDSISMVDGLIAEFMGKMENRDVPEELKSAHLIKFQFSSLPLRVMKREEVESSIADLKRKIDSFASDGGVLIYTGDLKWTLDSSEDEKEDDFTVKEAIFYSPVDHLVSEIAKLLSSYNSYCERIWLIATASYQTYLKCQMRKPPLDLQWSLQPVSVLSSGLSLNAASGRDSTVISFPRNDSQDIERKSFCFTEEDDILTCCQECKFNYEKEARLKSFPLHLSNKITENGLSPMPFWLKPQDIETSVKELRKKYNKLCSNLHQGRNNSTIFSSDMNGESYPWRNHDLSTMYSSWSNRKSIFADSETIPCGVSLLEPAQVSSALPRFRRQQSCHIEFSFSSKNQSFEPNLDSLRVTDDNEVKISLALGNSTYADEVTSDKLELSADLRLILQENVPWHCESIRQILEVLADFKTAVENKFILLQGNDSVGKRRLAIGIAESFFGSSECLFRMTMHRSTNAATLKKDVLEKALRHHERLVVLIEDIDSADPEFDEYLVNVFETGILEKHRSTIFILTVDGEKSCSEEMDSVIQMKLVMAEVPSDNGISDQFHKRKADWDRQNVSKSQRKLEFEMPHGTIKGEATTTTIKRMITNTLDLNIRADDDDDDEAPIRRLKIIEKIKNHIKLNRNKDKENLATEMFASKISKSFDEEVTGNRNIASFSIDETVLDEIFRGCGFYLNTMFEQWLEQVFKPSFRTIDTEGKRFSIRLGLGGKGGRGLNNSDDGFMGTSLPKRIQVSWTG